MVHSTTSHRYDPNVVVTSTRRQRYSSKRESTTAQQYRAATIDAYDNDDPEHICYYYDRAKINDIDTDDQSTANMSQQELIRHHDHDKPPPRRRKNRPGLELLPKLRQFLPHRSHPMSLKQSSDETSSTTNTTKDGGDSITILRVLHLSTSAEGSLLQLNVEAPPPTVPSERTSIPVRAVTPTASPYQIPLPKTSPRVRFLPDDGSSVPYDQRLDETAFVRKSILKPPRFGHPAEKHAPPVRISAPPRVHHDIRCHNDDEEEPRASYEHDEKKVFLESVAAIVIQTCVRRFLAVHTVVRMIWAEETCRSTNDPYGVRTRRSPQPVRSHHDVDDKEEDEYYVGVSRQGINTQQQEQRHQHIVSEDDDCMEVFHLAARIIQKAYRRHWTKSKAAISIQRIFRGYWARDCVLIDHYCATVLQALGRGYIVRVMLATTFQPPHIATHQQQQVTTHQQQQVTTHQPPQVTTHQPQQATTRQPSQATTRQPSQVTTHQQPQQVTTHQPQQATTHQQQQATTHHTNRTPAASQHHRIREMWEERASQHTAPVSPTPQY